MLLTIFGLFTLVYVLFNYYLLRGWYGWKEESTDKPETVKSIFVSVLIAVRNEEKNIERLLSDLEKQDHPPDKYEIILIDDHSEDRTREIINSFSKRSALNITALDLGELSRSPKKDALTLGVKQACGELIMVTDGDCQMGSAWISSFVNFYIYKNAKFISGPVTFEKTKSYFSKLQTIEFSSLIGAGAATLFYKKPIMCNAANMAFSKSAFMEANGFVGNEKLPSGDDIFLMNKIHQKFPESVLFLKDRNAIVETQPARRFRDFFYQRIRWAGKWRMTYGFEQKWLPVFIFSYHLFTLILYIKVILNQIYFSPFAVLILLKFLSEYLFLFEVLRFLDRKYATITYFIASIVYPVYAVMVGFLANFVKYSWKGRLYRN